MKFILTCIKDSFKQVINWETDTTEENKEPEGEAEIDQYEQTRLKVNSVQEEDNFESKRDILEIMSLQRVFSD